MKIAAGERYVTRDGDITSPLEIDPEPIAGQIWTAKVRGMVRNWAPDGSWAPPYILGLDLVKPSTKK